MESSIPLIGKEGFFRIEMSEWFCARSGKASVSFIPHIHALIVHHHISR
jgi:hypothetical protein